MRLATFFDKSESFFWQGADPPILARDLGNILPCTPSLSGQAFRPSLSPPNPDFVSVGLLLTALESFHPCTVPHYHQLHQPSTNKEDLLRMGGRVEGRTPWDAPCLPQTHIPDAFVIIFIRRVSQWLVDQLNDFCLTAHLDVGLFQH